MAGDLVIWPVCLPVGRGCYLFCAGRDIGRTVSEAVNVTDFPKYLLYRYRARAKEGTLVDFFHLEFGVVAICPLCSCPKYNDFP